MDTLRIQNTSLIENMDKLNPSGNSFLQKEIKKIIDFVADRKSIPALVILLKDPEFDIRWIAAEGLIKIGRRSIIPLLKVIRDGERSCLFDRGTHHILQNILSEKEKEAVKALLLSLNSYSNNGRNAPFEATLALKKTFRCKT